LPKPLKSPEAVEADFRLVHGERYTYDLTTYTRARDKMRIICSEHGEFWQRPSYHLRGYGCGDCTPKGRDRTATEVVIAELTAIHDGRYTYVAESYVGMNFDMRIICSIHGEFLQRAYHHKEGSGCPSCTKKQKKTPPNNSKITSGLDMETVALTRDGWKSYEDLHIGQMVLTYNAARDVQEWQPILALQRTDEMRLVRIEGRGLNVVCMPVHRWLTFRRTTINGVAQEVREPCATNALTKSHRIIGNAPYGGTGDLPVQPWCILEGKYGRDWPSILMHMPDGDRKGWLAGFLCADGHFKVASGRWMFTQKRGEHYEAGLAVLYLEAGSRISAYEHTHYNSKTMKVEICDSRSWGCQKIKVVDAGHGPVWSMQTANDTFVARRGDFITISGAEPL
jgi:hypothetical protein